MCIDEKRGHWKSSPIFCKINELRPNKSLVAALLTLLKSLQIDRAVLSFAFEQPSNAAIVTFTDCYFPPSPKELPVFCPGPKSGLDKSVGSIRLNVSNVHPPLDFRPTFFQAEWKIMRPSAWIPTERYIHGQRDKQTSTIYHIALSTRRLYTCMHKRDIWFHPWRLGNRFSQTLRVCEQVWTDSSFLQYPRLLRRSAECITTRCWLFYLILSTFRIVLVHSDNLNRKIIQFKYSNITPRKSNQRFLHATTGSLLYTAIVFVDFQKQQFLLSKNVRPMIKHLN